MERDSQVLVTLAESLAGEPLPGARRNRREPSSACNKFHCLVGEEQGCTASVVHLGVCNHGVPLAAEREQHEPVTLNGFSQSADLELKTLSDPKVVGEAHVRGSLVSRR